MAGITVGVVALPLALAFGITTGLGAQAGLITAIVAGFVAAVFGGSNVQVSGPTGAMTVVLVPVVARYGVDAVYVVGILAGALVVLAGIRASRPPARVRPVAGDRGVHHRHRRASSSSSRCPPRSGWRRPEGENTVAVAVPGRA